MQHFIFVMDEGQTADIKFTVYSYGLRSTVYNSGAGIRAAIASASSNS